jgi:type 1 glutamine amidotransferase
LGYVKKNSVKLKWMAIGVICLPLLLVGSGSSNGSEGTTKTETIHANKTNHMDQLRVLVLTGGHNFDEQPFYKMFADFDNTEIDHVEIQKECTYFDDTSQWDYDVIVFYNFRNSLSSKGQENLLKLCDKGIGMVILHHAIAGFPEWSMWPKIVGAQYFLKDTEIDGEIWKRCTYKHGVTYHVTLEKSKSMVTDGLKDFEISDEVYKGYRLKSDNHILLTTDEPLSQKEIGWIRTFQKSKVCYIQLGHGKEAFGNSHYKQLIKQSIDWAGIIEK